MEKATILFGGEKRDVWITKGNVKQHYRTTKTGKKVMVKQHTDKRTKKQSDSSGGDSKPLYGKKIDVSFSSDDHKILHKEIMSFAKMVVKVAPNLEDEVDDVEDSDWLDWIKSYINLPSEKAKSKKQELAKKFAKMIGQED